MTINNVPMKDPSERPLKSYKLKKSRKKINSRMIISRWGEPKDLFGLVEYLISEHASYITGQDFVVDGGWLAKGL